MSFLLSDSLMCADLLHLGDQLEVLDQAMDWHHADVMDGHFCPNLTLSPDLVAAVCAHTQKPVDVHLMVERPGDWLERFAQAGAAMLTVHAETIGANAFRTFREIRRLGCKVGVAIHPATPLETIRYYMDELDCLTLMTVDIGYAGQPMVPQVLDKLREVAQIKRERGLPMILQVDGCCNRSTYARYRDAGAEMLVMGSGLFGLDPDRRRALPLMRQAQQEALSAVGEGIA